MIAVGFIIKNCSKLFIIIIKFAFIERLENLVIMNFQEYSVVINCL